MLLTQYLQVHGVSLWAIIYKFTKTFTALLHKL